MEPLTLTQLANIMVGCPVPKLEIYLPFLNAAMEEGEINTPVRAAMFLGQVGHESMSFRYFEEIASGAAYEGRKDLGNTQAGDGKRYKGRGIVQITGRANYQSMSNDMGVDFISDPDLAATPEYAFRTAVWFWNTRSLNDIADVGSEDAFKRITKKINGGLNGWPDRLARWNKAKTVLGIE